MKLGRFVLLAAIAATGFSAANAGAETVLSKIGANGGGVNEWTATFQSATVYTPTGVPAVAGGPAGYYYGSPWDNTGVSDFAYTKLGVTAGTFDANTTDSWMSVDTGFGLGKVGNGYITYTILLDELVATTADAIKFSGAFTADNRVTDVSIVGFGGASTSIYSSALPSPTAPQGNVFYKEFAGTTYLPGSPSGTGSTASPLSPLFLKVTVFNEVTLDGSLLPTSPHGLSFAGEFNVIAGGASSIPLPSSALAGIALLGGVAYKRARRAL